ncbi:aspartic peptidase domain-containing protein [Xylariales sp. PMI_506]|nr:aspartic peptidase domain-containing protein [Xylariales sp. PMI_506]
MMFPGIDCTTCNGHTLFNPNVSSTFSPLPGTQKQAGYSSGIDTVPIKAVSVEYGVVVHDKVTLGNLTVSDQGFLLVTQSAAAFNDMPIDGILGLGFPNITAFDEEPWFWNLWYSGQLASPVVSFYTPAGDIDGAEITLGGIDDTKFEGEIQYTPLVGSEGAYNVPSAAFYVNGKLLPLLSSSSHMAMLSTAVAYLQAPSYIDAKEIYAFISPNITLIDTAGAWGAPCEELESVAVDLTFTLGPLATAVNVTVPKESFNLGEYPGLPGICQAAINSPNLADSFDYTWVLGVPLLKNYYTVWDSLNFRVGWGTLKAPSS